MQAARGRLVVANRPVPIKIKGMKKLSLAFAAFALSAPVAAAAQDVAPAVKRKPAAPAPVAQNPAGRAASEQQYQAALAAAVAKDGGDAALDTSLIRVMSRLLAAGQCREASSLAARDGRKELASRAQQFCK